MTHIPHAHLVAETTESFRDFSVTNARNIYVRSTLVSAAKGAMRYRVEIIRHGNSAESLPYSLYNIRVQGRRWKVKVEGVRGQNVMFVRPKPRPPGSPGENHEVQTAGPFDDRHQPEDLFLRRVQPSRKKKKNERRIWFINFDGDRCELIICSFRPEPIEDKVTAFGEHDISPPPPEGGGEEGEEEEEDPGDEGEDPGEE